MIRSTPRSTRTDSSFPYTAVFRSVAEAAVRLDESGDRARGQDRGVTGLAAVVVEQRIARDFGAPFALRGPHVRRHLAAGARVEVDHAALAGRSEEHTSELQSLMRISYAVFR